MRNVSRPEAPIDPDQASRTGQGASSDLSKAEKVSALGPDEHPDHDKRGDQHGAYRGRLTGCYLALPLRYAQYGDGRRAARTGGHTRSAGTKVDDRDRG
jgi:hypothetical protein